MEVMNIESSFLMEFKCVEKMFEDFFELQK